ncbi:MAG: leucine-rich repeat protein [Clostridia bacterium]|nr:leucine-rich repeat protein [Clostridia bacterium]
MKKIRLSLAFLIVLVMFIAAFSLSVFAEESGYALNKDKQETNIKWTIKDRILTFEIDASATDKVAATTLDVNPITGAAMGYGSKVDEFQNVIKCVIGDGITGASRILSNIPTLLEVEIPTSLVRIQALFEQSKALESVYVKGTEPKKYHADLSYITTLGTCNFNASGPIETVTFGDNLTGTIPQETFQWNSKIKALTIPVGVTKIGAKAFANCNGIDVMTVLGKETQIDANAFFNNKYYPAIKAYAGSAAEKFAKENGFTFINIETGEEVEGEKPRPGETHKLPVSKFDTTGATAHGLMFKEGLVNNYWAYYADTKTLVIASRTLNGYNETGTVGNCEGNGWRDYINEIEHIEIIGDRLDKISGYAFMNYKSLKDVKVKGQPGQWDPGIFTGCTNLTTIWYEGGERVEGRADLSRCGKVNNIFQGTAIKEVLLRDTVKNIEVGLPFSIRTILAPNITPELIQYCKDNNFDLVNSKNPEEKYSYYIEIDPTLPYCGDRAVYDFDEATGTLTIYGSGSIPDIQNFFGGGSKNQWWRGIRNEVKHIVIADGIKSIGKYAFCELRNVETIRLPDRDDLVVWNCAFQSCENVRSITRGDKEAILGTADLSGISKITSWSFAYNYLIANVILSETLTEVGSTAFEDCINLQNVYSAPGTFGESFAKEKGIAFFDIASNAPQPIECTPPEVTSEEETESISPDSESAETKSNDSESAEVKPDDSESAEVTTSDEFFFIDPDEISSDNIGNTEKDYFDPTVIIVVAVILAAAITAVIVTIIVVKKRKK